MQAHEADDNLIVAKSQRIATTIELTLVNLVFVLFIFSLRSLRHTDWYKVMIGNLMHWSQRVNQKLRDTNCIINANG